MSTTMLARSASTGGSAPFISDGERWIRKMVDRCQRQGKFAEFHCMTPSIAEALLERNPDNRAIVKASVERWNAALRAGEWQCNGEPIIISIEGLLNDGGHRCRSIVETGVSTEMLFVFGVDRDSRFTVDEGSKRTAGQVLGMSRISNGNLIAATLRHVLNLESGLSLGHSYTTIHIKAAYEAKQDVLKAYGAPHKAASNLGQPQSLLCAINYLFRKHYPDHSEEFFVMLASGVAPSKDHPVAALRARLISNMSQKAKLPITEVAALVIKAMNFFIEDKTAKNLKWQPKPSMNDEGKVVSAGEAFPKIAGL